MVTKKKKRVRKAIRTARLNLMITPKLKRSMHAYAKRHHKSLSSIIVDHFLDLLKKESEPDVEQI